jgi:predicted nucleic acid-binding protein
LILLDTSGLFALYDRGSRFHGAVERALAEAGRPRVISPFVLAELDYFVANRIGVAEELALLAEVGRGAYELAQFGAPDLVAAHTVIAKYRDQQVGLADASIVVLAGRYRTNRVLTLDERHFRVMQTPRGEPFRILPADL